VIDRPKLARVLISTGANFVGRESFYYKWSKADAGFVDCLGMRME
jgi:hypothetical protein